MTPKYPSKTDLPPETRARLIDLLNANLAAAIDLSLQAKQAHWNVKGPTFIALHELFDKVHDQAGGWTDLLAERAVQLGGLADGTLQTVTGRTPLRPYPAEIATGRDHLEALSTGVATFGKAVRAAIKTADGAGDPGSADLFTEISRDADKTLWFLEAHLQSASGDSA